MLRGQTCANCAGDCCTLRGVAPPGSWLGRHFRQCRVKTIREHGGSVLVEVAEKRRCFRQLPNGSCSEYTRRPALCKSYYCHGKLWHPRPEVKEVDILVRREQLKTFCLSQLSKLFDAGNFDRFVELLERGDGPFDLSFKLVLTPEVVRRIKEAA